MDGLCEHVTRINHVDYLGQRFRCQRPEGHLLETHFNRVAGKFDITWTDLTTPIVTPIEAGHAREEVGTPVETVPMDLVRALLTLASDYGVADLQRIVNAMASEETE